MKTFTSFTFVAEQDYSFNSDFKILILKNNKNFIKTALLFEQFKINTCLHTSEEIYMIISCSNTA